MSTLEIPKNQIHILNSLSSNISSLLQNQLQLDQYKTKNSFNITASGPSNISTLESSSTFYLIMKILLILFILIHLAYFLFMIIRINYCNKDEDEKKKIRKINEECSICLDKIKDEAQLLCSHSYCANCLLYYTKNNDFDNDKIKCPVCRVESKFIIPQFEENEENKELFGEIARYNNKVTSAHKTSFCLCFDFLKFSFLLMKKILNFRNPNYIAHRRILCTVIFIFLFFVVYPLFKNGSKGSTGEIIQDIIMYIFLILIIAEAFYRRIRRQNEQILRAQIQLVIEQQIANELNIEGNLYNV